MYYKYCSGQMQSNRKIVLKEFLIRLIDILICLLVATGLGFAQNSGKFYNDFIITMDKTASYIASMTKFKMLTFFCPY